MNTFTKINIASMGQVTLEPLVLQHLGARRGDDLVMELKPDGRAEVRFVPANSIEHFFGSIQDDGPPIPLEEIRESIEAGWAGER